VARAALPGLRARLIAVDMETATTHDAAPRAPLIGARQLVGATGGSAATTVWLAFIGLLTTPYMLHQLGAAAYGVFALITIVSGYLSNLELGFGHALVRFVARARGMGDRAEEHRVLETSLAVFVSACAIAATVALLLAPHVVGTFADVPRALRGQALTGARLGAAILGFTLLSAYWSSALVGLGRFSIVVATRAAIGTLVSAAAVVSVALGGGLDTVLLTQLVVTSLSVCVLAAAVISTHDRWIVPRIHRATFTSMARFSGFVFVAGVAYQLMLQGPATVLAGSAGTAELATYAVPAIVLQQLTLLAVSASLGFLPLASAASASTDRSRLAAIFRSHLRLTLLVMGPIVAYLAVFGEPLMATWIDARFAAQAAGPLRFLAGAALMLALSGPAADVARGLGRPGWVVVFTVASAGLTVVLSLVLVSAHGAAGVAFALCAALTMTVLPLVVIVSRRLLSLSTVALAAGLAPVLLAGLASAALYLLGAVVSDSFAGALLSGLLVTVLYALVAYRYVLDDRERRAFRRSSRES